MSRPTSRPISVPASRQMPQWHSPRRLFALIFLPVAFGLLFVMRPASADSHRNPDADSGLMSLADVQRGQLLFRTVAAGRYAPAPLIATEVDIDIGGIVARTVVRQHFVNPTKDWLEGRYVFPLPENAAVNRMTLRIGDRVIEAKIAERRAARRAYEAAKRDGRRAALVEQHRPNIFSNNVANIPPGGRIAVELRYVQQLPFDQGKFSLRFPLVVAPRFDPAAAGRHLVRLTPGNGEGPVSPDAGAPPVVIPVRNTEILPPLNPVSLSVTLDAGLALDDVASPSHRLTIEKLGTGKRRVALRDDAVPADRDFVLDWTPALGTTPLVAAFRETVGDFVYLLTLVMPPAPTDGNHANPPVKRPRDVVFILDRSGSMGGVSIRAARAALDAAVQRLGPADRFNLIRFSNETDALFDTELRADRTNKLFASLYLRATEAGGGTVMKPALYKALPDRAVQENAEGVPDTGIANPGDVSRLRQVVFLTDGAVANETDLFRDIRRRLGASRLFTVGIGSAPNSYFMRKAAEAGRGAYLYIGNVSEVQAKIGALFEKLDRPALTGLAHRWTAGDSGTPPVESFPSVLPDLYFGEPVVLVSRMPVAALADGPVLGLTGAGWETRLPASNARPAAGVAAVWARAKVTALADSRHDGVPEEIVRAAITEVGLTHSLVTRYTSLLATERNAVRPADRRLLSGDAPVNLPHGWKFASTMDGKLLKKAAAPMQGTQAARSARSSGMARPVALPAGATPFFVHLMAGSGLIVLAALLYLVARPRRTAGPAR